MARNHEPFHRLLVPLEGSEHSSGPIVDTLCPLIVADVELVVLHVFTAATIPPVMDRPNRDLAMWGSEFLARHCPNASRIELRTGSIASRVNDVCREEHADLIVLELVTAQLARTGGSGSRRAHPRDRPRPADSGEMTGGSFS